MNKKIKDLYDSLPGEHKELAKLAEHVCEALRKLEEEHRRIVALDAIAGIKPDKQEEIVFRETIKAVQTVLIDELEKTAKDLEHRGDKNWVKNYKDGIL